MEQCGNCRFNNIGTCRRYPFSTSVSALEHQRPLHVKHDSWCGEWEEHIDIMEEHPASILAQVREMCAKSN